MIQTYLSNAYISQFLMRWYQITAVLKSIPSPLMWCCQLLNQLKHAFWYSSLGIVFSSEFTTLARLWAQENFSASLSRKETARSIMVPGQDARWVGQDLHFCLSRYRVMVLVWWGLALLWRRMMFWVVVTGCQQLTVISWTTFEKSVSA